MGYRIAVDAVLLTHLAFIGFVVAGGPLVIRWKQFAFIHVPAVLWAALIEIRGWICPLTPLSSPCARPRAVRPIPGDSSSNTWSP